MSWVAIAPGSSPTRSNRLGGHRKITGNEVRVPVVAALAALGHERSEPLWLALVVYPFGASLPVGRHGRVTVADRSCAVHGRVRHVGEQSAQQCVPRSSLGVCGTPHTLAGGCRERRRARTSPLPRWVASFLGTRAPATAGVAPWPQEPRGRGRGLADNLRPLYPPPKWGLPPCF